MGILDGKPGVRTKKAAAIEEPKAENVDSKAALAAMDLLKAELERRAGELSAAHADLRVARADAAAALAKLEGVRAQLMEEADACGEAEASLLAEQATSAGLRGQLETERATRAALQASLDHAVTAAATREPITFPKHEPIAYDVLMVNPETGERKQVSIKPAKGKN